ncbi:MAG: hypothetical protein J0G97_05070, partial [Rhizobium pusense]|nr:hypothetical protein [Agrobacterium pusense]
NDIACNDLAINCGNLTRNVDEVACSYGFSEGTSLSAGLGIGDGIAYQFLTGHVICLSFRLGIAILKNLNRFQKS